MSNNGRYSHEFICHSEILKTGRKGVRFDILDREVTRAAFVIRHEHGVAAFFNQCSHRALELDWSPGEFFDFDGKNLICATHGALYSPKNGECLGGPCSGTALTQIQVVEEQGDVFLTDHRYHVG
ncbi:MAG: Rieske 2Fe-2S domain-containing protein [Proteobacteria bacterium]|nr:Rieske 2Fe-2S domain-containing protein [Pseudomonadota bacterium]MBT5624521.1 Rieske 2Fe-2S domain-containing protein [Pseudomonadota bacterium]